MSTLAPTLQAFFTDRLARQRQASPHTIAAYRDAIKLLLAFAAQRTGKPPSRLDIADLDAPLIGAFLNHLEAGRGNSARTRNARRSAWTCSSSETSPRTANHHDQVTTAHRDGHHRCGCCRPIRFPRTSSGISPTSTALAAMS